MTGIADLVLRCHAFVPIAVFAICAIDCASFPSSSNSSDFVGVTLTGVHHIGPELNIAEFYGDGYYSSNVGNNGGGSGGGRFVCFVMLPKK